MNESMIDRINALARKARAEGLTEDEKMEQMRLRREFIAAIRMNIRSQLDNIDIVEADGSVTNLGEKYGANKAN